ncbi:MAG: hypothetical protein ACXVCP_08495 [Bdellovibrio sp.]
MKKIFLTSLLLSMTVFAGPKRIQSVLFDKGNPHKIFLHPGLGTVITFPCFVSDSFLGDESQAEIKPSPSNRKNLLLSLRSTASRATNLIVRCEGQHSHFVLDIVPSKIIHQDILDIRAAFGRPELIELETQKKIESKTETPQTKKIVIMAPKLLEANTTEQR